MITSQKEYQITKQWAQKFLEAYWDFGIQNYCDVDPMLVTAHREAILVTYTSLINDIEEYEKNNPSQDN